MNLEHVASNWKNADPSLLHPLAFWKSANDMKTKGQKEGYTVCTVLANGDRP
jgi:hypothetical protein